MTDQEQLAALIGDEGKRRVTYKDGWGTEHKSALGLKPIEELLKIAEGRLRTGGWHGWLTLPPHRERFRRPLCMNWRDAQGNVEEIYSKYAETEQAARMKCAIEVLKRMQREKEARNENTD